MTLLHFQCSGMQKGEETAFSAQCLSLPYHLVPHESFTAGAGCFAMVSRLLFACALTKSVDSLTSTDLFMLEMSVPVLLLVFLNSDLVTDTNDRK